MVHNGITRTDRLTNTIVQNKDTNLILHYIYLDIFNTHTCTEIFLNEF